MPPQLKTTLTPTEAAAVTIACFGLSILWSVQAVAAGFPSSPFTTNGFVGLIATEIFLAIVAIAFLWVRGYDIATLIPRPSFMGSVGGIALFIAAWIVGVVVV